MDDPIRILVVEDSASQLFIYRQLLSQAGHVVFAATTGADALEMVCSQAPEIVLLDRVLPDIDGSEVCARIKTSPDSADTYVIMLSGLKTTEADRVSGLEAGADDYVLKPVGKRELLARIRVAQRLRRATEQLRASEMQFRTLAENSPDYILRLGRDGQVYYMNPAAEQLLGLDGEWSSHRVAQFAHRLVGGDAMSAQVAAVFATGKGGRIKTMLRVDNGMRHLDTQLAPEPARGGEVSSILAVTRDYTDFVIAEQEIRRLATVIRQAVDAVQIADDQGRIVYTNGAYTELTGVSSQDAMGQEMPGHAYLCPEHGACRLLDHLAGDVERWQGLLAMELSDGETRDLETTLFAIRDVDGKITNYAALQRDVTDRQRSVEERDVSMRVASAVRRAVMRRDVLAQTLEQILLLRPVVAAIYGRLQCEQAQLEVESVLGVPADFAGMRFPLAETLSAQVLHEGKPCVLDEREFTGVIHRAPWPPTTRSIAGVPVATQDRVDGVLWVAASAPITERFLNLLASLADMLGSSLERAELYEAIQRYADELEQRVAERTQELARANEQLRELDRLKSKFVSNVSHELRTPIANLKLYLSLLERGKADKRSHYEAMLRHSANRLGQLVQDILSLSRLEMAQLQPTEFGETDLNAVVAQVVQHHQPQADAAGLTLVFEQDPQLPLMWGDFNQLSQLATNLIGNSLLYTEAGSVHVRTRYEDSSPPCIHLEVEDTGVGIDDEDINHIFDRFYRGNNHPDADIPGTGLGLAIVKEIVNIHHGRIELSSVVGKGTRFDVILPCQRPSG